MIRLLTKDGCSQCSMAKEFLTDNNLEYEVINLSDKEEREWRKHYRESGYQLLPVIEGDDWSLDGFNRDVLDNIIRDKYDG